YVPPAVVTWVINPRLPTGPKKAPKFPPPGLRLLLQPAAIWKRKRARERIGLVVPPERFLNCVPGVRVTRGHQLTLDVASVEFLLTSAAATGSPIQPSRIRSREGRKVPGRLPPPRPRR